eukprot:2970114-Rhodomonas_salina.1
MTLLLVLVLSLQPAFLPPAYQPAVARRKFLAGQGTVQYAYNQCAVPTARPRPHATARACTRRTGVPGYPPVPAYASTL